MVLLISNLQWVHRPARCRLQLTQCRCSCRGNIESPFASEIIRNILRILKCFPFSSCFFPQVVLLFCFETMVLVRGHTRIRGAIFLGLFFGGFLSLLEFWDFDPCSMFWFHSKEIREQGKASMWPVCLAKTRGVLQERKEEDMRKQIEERTSWLNNVVMRSRRLRAKRIAGIWSWLLLCGGHLLVRSHFAKVEHWKWMACNRIASLMPVQASMESIPQGCATPRSMLQANAGIGYCKICRKEAPRSRAHIAGELQNLLNLATATAAANRHISQWVTPWTGKWYDCRNSCLWRITFLFGFQDFPKMIDYWLMIK